MNSAPRIGVVGGYGAVGHSVVRQLQHWRLFRVRIGGRNKSRGQPFVESLSGNPEWVTTEAHDAQSLQRFCRGCDVVVNCAGSACLLGEKIGSAAFAQGAHYIDASGYAALNLPPSRRTALLAAGMYPGLSGLLPRFLAARGFDRVSCLTAYIGGCDYLSHTAATDYLESVKNGFGEADAAWLGGRRVSKVLEGGQKVNLPFFPRSVMRQPYLTAEAERLAAYLALSDAKWYSVFDGPHVVSALPLAASRQDAESFVKAAKMDLFGRDPYQILMFEMRGMLGDMPVCRSLMLKASGGAQLTGIAAAAGVKAALSGEIPHGEHYFAETVDAAGIVTCLRQSDAILALEVFDNPLMMCEEGAI